VTSLGIVWFVMKEAREGGAAKTVATMSEDHSSQAEIEIRFAGFTSPDSTFVTPRSPGRARVKKGSATGSGSGPTRYRTLKHNNFANEIGGAARI
jgi:hypothetical protein